MSSTKWTVLAVVLLLAAQQAVASYDTYIAEASGKLEKPTAVKTRATAKSTLKVWPTYAKVSVAVNYISQFTMAHIHFTGVNGSNPNSSGAPVLWLLPFLNAPTDPVMLSPPLSISGTLLTGELTFTGANLKGSVYPANATDADKFTLFRKWAANNQLYFNAHTVKYPAGEIRGNYKKK